MGPSAAWFYSVPRVTVSIFFFLVSSAVSAQTVVSTQKIHRIDQQQRLSAWLQSQEGQKRLHFDTGLSWLSTSVAVAQQRRIADLRYYLNSRALMASGDPFGANRLLRLLSLLPHAGRVPLPSTDGRWLEANPSRDPMLMPGDQILSFSRPSVVTVVLSTGQICAIRHTPGQPAQSYAQQCANGSSRSLFNSFWSVGDWVWIAQPNGQVAKTSLQPIGGYDADEPAPGAWIWAPDPRSGYDDAFSQDFVAVLAGQGPAGDYLRVAGVDTLTQQLAFPTHVPISRNQWGAVGLIHMPTARMASDSELAVSRTHSDPYRRINVFMQALPWMEFGFRYTDIRNKYYGQLAFSGTQTYKDKSIDAKFRIFGETNWLPEVSVGLIDVGGTGLFSSEYLVASKRFGSVDLTGGLAWGYLGSGGQISNPFGRWSERFKTRRGSDVGVGGKFAGSTWFTGPMSAFAGIEYQTPWPNWTAKLEYDANDHGSEPYRDGSIYTVPAATSRFNYGLVYRFSNWIDLSLGYERGNQISLGLTLHSVLNKNPTPKLLDPPPVPIAMTTTSTSDRAFTAWQTTRDEIERVSTWRVESLERDGRDLYVTFSDTYGQYLSDRVDLIGRILHRDAPAIFDRFIIQIRNKGLPVSTVIVDRRRFVEDHTQLIPREQKREQPAVVMVPPEALGNPGVSLLRAPASSDQFRWGDVTGGFGVSYAHHLGGPDGFWIYQIGVNARAEWRLRRDTWLVGIGNYRLIDNYDQFKINSTSQLPQVRTRMREYYTTSRWTLPVVQATHMGEVPMAPAGHYYSVYGGMLEWMFAGVGAEYLYRPWGSRFALGVDLNRVRQRDYEQDFGLRDYRATTGHVTGYWETGWNDILATVKAGQYLAEDRGVTVDVSRVFQNGVTFGMYATKTNVSAERFGEGSFDKGVYLTIPFDAILPKRSTFRGTFMWQPITRDGGAILGRRYPLYGMTGQRSPRTLSFGQPAED